MIETLECAAGHSWDREVKKGKKPKWCDEHRPAERELAEPASGTRVTEDVLDVLTGPGHVDPELRLKLEYCAVEVDRKGRDTDDVKLLLERAKDLVREHRRR